MSDTEIDWNEDMKAYEMCTTCLNIALDAAYSDGFKTEDDEFIIIEDDEYDEPISLYYNNYGEADD